jgi:Chaperone of endosialidase
MAQSLNGQVPADTFNSLLRANLNAPVSPLSPAGFYGLSWGSGADLGVSMGNGYIDANNGFSVPGRGYWNGRGVDLGSGAGSPALTFINFFSGTAGDLSANIYRDIGNDGNWIFNQSGLGSTFFQRDGVNRFVITADALLYYGSNWSSGSDRSLKKDITPLAFGLDFINQLQPVSYRFNSDYAEGEKVRFGLIAQDVREQLDGDHYALHAEGCEDTDGKQGLSYLELIAPLIKAVQELSAQNAVLLQRIDNLENPA